MSSSSIISSVSSISSISGCLTSFPSQVDVLIVGAGPSGLSLAIDLARRGINFIIIDINASHVTESRALMVNSRTLEIFDDFGVIDDALNSGFKVRGIKFYLNNKDSTEILLRNLSGQTTYPYALILQQREIEKILIKKLKSLGHEVLRPAAIWKVEGVHEDEDKLNKYVLKHTKTKNCASNNSLNISRGGQEKRQKSIMFYNNSEKEIDDGMKRNFSMRKNLELFLSSFKNTNNWPEIKKSKNKGFRSSKSAISRIENKEEDSNEEEKAKNFLENEELAEFHMGEESLKKKKILNKNSLVNFLSKNKGMDETEQDKNEHEQKRNFSRVSSKRTSSEQSLNYMETLKHEDGVGITESFNKSKRNTQKINSRSYTRRVEEENEEENDNYYKIVACINELNKDGTCMNDNSLYGHKVRARFIVGCDGGRSLVRKASCIKVEEKSYTIKFTICDAKVIWAVEYELDKVQVIIQGQMLIIIIHLFNDVWRIVFSYREVNQETQDEKGIFNSSSYLSIFNSICSMKTHRSQNMEQDDVSITLQPPTENEVIDLINKAIPRSNLINLIWGSSYKMNMKVAETFMNGHAFLVGDAAHIHPPILGYGMNAGIQDAYNLGWKLATVLKGGGSSTLLNSYNLERKQYAEEITDFTSSLFDQIFSEEQKNIFGRFCLSSVFKVMSSVEFFQKSFAKKISMLDQKYKASDVISKAGFVFCGIKPGEKALDALVKCLPLEGSDVLRVCPRYIYDYYRGTHHSLLLCLNLLPPGSKKKNVFGCQTLEPTPRWSMSCFEKLARTARLLSETIGVSETCMWGGLSVIWVLFCNTNKPTFAFNGCKDISLNNNYFGYYSFIKNALNECNEYYHSVISGITRSDKTENGKILKDAKEKKNTHKSSSKSTKLKKQHYQIQQFHLPEKLAQCLRSANIPGKLKVVYDFANEVTEKYGLNLSEPNGNNCEKENSGAYFLIRPDKYVSHCGYADDLNGISLMIDYALKYF